MAPSPSMQTLKQSSKKNINATILKKERNRPEFSAGDEMNRNEVCCSTTTKKQGRALDRK